MLPKQHIVQGRCRALAKRALAKTLARLPSRRTQALLLKLPRHSSPDSGKKGGAVIVRRPRQAIRLRNRIAIEVHAASFKSTRGYTVVAGLIDELAFWESDENSAEPDVEIINAIRPGMATIPGAMLLCASTKSAAPQARRARRSLRRAGLKRPAPPSSCRLGKLTARSERSRK